MNPIETPQTYQEYVNQNHPTLPFSKIVSMPFG